MPEADDRPDEYGAGGPVGALERQVAGMLGKPAARFVIKGVIAQQAALRLCAEDPRLWTVALHPLSHLDVDEMNALERLQPLQAIRLGRTHPFGVTELEAAGEPISVVTTELPLRRGGFAVPEWDDLVAVSTWCRDHQVPLHIDGARLWESAPYYQRSLAEIAALGDSVYVSFYKGLGGLAGCVLAGSDDFLARATRRSLGTVQTCTPCTRTRWPPLPGSSDTCSGWSAARSLNAPAPRHRAGATNQRPRSGLRKPRLPANAGKASASRVGPGSHYLVHLLHPEAVVVRPSGGLDLCIDMGRQTDRIR